ncbi:MAG: GntR family transcriptional regulator [Capsulimonas sp.]|uniref:GntR family transcriptional regulator n=1 Tax=Capsulimonas sp. TaxID=2494211 RepID=UPI0032630DEA
MTTPPEPRTLAPSAKHPTNSVASVLRDQIQSGNYKAGDWLPTERVLAEDLGVDRRVIRTAINQLVQSGLVIRRPHCRPIVGPAEVDPPEALVRGPVASYTSSSFIALLMWHGGGQMERAFTSQQRIFWGMNQALADAGYHAVFVDLGAVASEEENAAREAEQLQYLLKRGFGGAVFYPYAYRSNRALVEEVAATIPLVTIDRKIDSADTDFVGVDNHQSMYSAIAHLIAQGHQRIAYVTKNEPIRAVQERIQGYIDAVRDADLDEIVLSIPSRDKEQDWVSVDAVFQLPTGKRPTAAAVFNDYTAIFLMQRLESMGLSVPGDVALTGFDDIVPILPNGVGLTTVAQPYEEIGKKAVEVLLQRLQNPAGPKKSVELPAKLVVRESSSTPGVS